jgi:cytochrome P450 family 4
MEEKVVLSKILVNFHLEAVDDVKDIKMVPDLILRPVDGIRLKLTKRK